MFGEERTIFKRSDKGKKIETKKPNAWGKLKFNKKSMEIIRKIEIGRDENCDISFKDDDLISRKHAIVEIIQDVLYIRDLGSTNGTYVNKKPLMKNQKFRLSKGDTIAIGKQRLKLS